MAKRIKKQDLEPKENGQAEGGVSIEVVPPSLDTGKGGRRVTVPSVLIITPLAISTAVFRIRSRPRSSLIVHAWSEKAIKMMLAKQCGQPEALTGRKKKDPVADFNGSRYISTEGWDGFPAVAIKAALVNTCRLVKGFPMTQAKRIFFVSGDGEHEAGMELIRIQGANGKDIKPAMRRDMVRLETGVADIRFRAEYKQWEADVVIDFDSSIISKAQLAALLERAGYSEGLCEWRPGAPNSNSGMHGRWTILGQG